MGIGDIYKYLDLKLGGWLPYGIPKNSAKNYTIINSKTGESAPMGDGNQGNDALGNLLGTVTGGNEAEYNKWVENMIDRQEAYQNQSAQKAMDFSADQAEIQRQWQEQMSNTAYTRARADMENAGINPILAYQQGGAATPSGASASGIAQSAPSGATGAVQGEQLIKMVGIIATLVESMLPTTILKGTMNNAGEASKTIERILKK